MVQRVVITGLLVLLPVLWTGCEKACCETAGAVKASSNQAAAPSESPAGSLPEGGEIAAKTKEITVEITGMTWPVGWPRRVQKALQTLPWVRKVDVDFAKKHVVTTVEVEKYEEEALVKALEKAGFGATVAK